MNPAPHSADRSSLPGGNTAAHVVSSTSKLSPNQSTFAVHAAAAVQSDLGAILLLSNDDSLRSMMRSFLEHAGYLVFSCGDADRASAIVFLAPVVDLLLVDQLSLTDGGLKLAVEFSRTRTKASVACLAGPDAATEVAEFPGWHFLSKALPMTDLLGRIHRIFEERQHRTVRSSAGDDRALIPTPSARNQVLKGKPVSRAREIPEALRPSRLAPSA